MFPIPLALTAVIAVGLAIGLINAAGAAKLGIPPFIVTLAGLKTFRGRALLATGAQSIGGMPHELTDFARDELLGVPQPVLEHGGDRHGAPFRIDDRQKKRQADMT